MRERITEKNGFLKPLGLLLIILLLSLTCFINLVFANDGSNTEQDVLSKEMIEDASQSDSLEEVAAIPYK
ncbi:MAG: hypothetical protein JSV24_05060 [Bacteroidales bacterium]|nr:MAG: hypothetical protein JSV24_05060 [Bacteroidales bacterium]